MTLRHGYSPLPSQCGGLQAPPPAWAAKRAASAALLALFGLAFLVAFWPGSPAPHGAGQSGLRGAGGGGAAPRASAAAPARQAPEGKVLLELFVMSMCPDAKFCERQLEPVVRKLRNIVHVKTQYIQQAAGGAFTCKHGAAECAGNRQQLCAAAHTAPRDNYPRFYRFLTCLWDEEGDSLPLGSSDLARICLKKVGYSSSQVRAIEDCTDGDEGAALMQRSADTVVSRHVINSCTVAIGGRTRCVRDGGAWRDCPGGSADSDFARDLCAAYRQAMGRDAPECASEPVRRQAAAPSPPQPAATAAAHQQRPAVAAAAAHRQRPAAAAAAHQQQPAAAAQQQQRPAAAAAAVPVQAKAARQAAQRGAAPTPGGAR